jgi:hypothetical protein
MLMKGPKKKGIALIISKMKGPSESEDKMMPEGEPMDDKAIALDSAAEEVLAAIERKDARMLRESLVALMEMAEEESESDEMEKED